jgi:hypothetical protein
MIGGRHSARGQGPSRVSRFTLLLRCTSPQLAHRTHHGRRPRCLLTKGTPAAGVTRLPGGGAVEKFHRWLGPRRARPVILAVAFRVLFLGEAR